MERLGTTTAANRGSKNEIQHPHYSKIEQQFKDAVQTAGIPFVGEIIGDGKLHRCHVEGHRSGSKNGAYILHLNGTPAGWAMDYKTGCILNDSVAILRQLVLGIQAQASSKNYATN